MCQCFEWAFWNSWNSCRSCRWGLLSVFTCDTGRRNSQLSWSSVVVTSLSLLAWGWSLGPRWSASSNDTSCDTTCKCSTSAFYCRFTGKRTCLIGFCVSINDVYEENVARLHIEPCSHRPNTFSLAYLNIGSIARPTTNPLVCAFFFLDFSFAFLLDCRLLFLLGSRLPPLLDLGFLFLSSRPPTPCRGTDCPSLVAKSSCLIASRPISDASPAASANLSGGLSSRLGPGTMLLKPTHIGNGATRAIHTQFDQFGSQ